MRKQRENERKERELLQRRGMCVFVVGSEGVGLLLSTKNLEDLRALVVC